MNNKSAANLQLYQQMKTIDTIVAVLIEPLRNNLFTTLISDVWDAPANHEHAYRLACGDAEQLLSFVAQLTNAAQIGKSEEMMKVIEQWGKETGVQGGCNRERE